MLSLTVKSIDTKVLVAKINQEKIYDEEIINKISQLKYYNPNSYKFLEAFDVKKPNIQSLDENQLRSIILDIYLEKFALKEANRLQIINYNEIKEIEKLLTNQLIIAKYLQYKQQKTNQENKNLNDNILIFSPIINSYKQEILNKSEIKIYVKVKKTQLEATLESIEKKEKEHKQEKDPSQNSTIEPLILNNKPENISTNKSKEEIKVINQLNQNNQETQEKQNSQAKIIDNNDKTLQQSN